MSITQVSHDPFARECVMRESVQGKAGGCDWCGQARRNGRLFRYGTQSDGYGARINWARGEFCSVGCCRAYHG